MVDRVKMPRGDRAKQFAPFDALKGLQETMRIKEYEHDRIVCGEMSEDEIKEITAVLCQLEKGDLVEISFFRDGHIIHLCGKSKIEALEQKLFVGAFDIKFEEIKAIKKLSSENS